jgi:ribonuclease VapC
MPNTTRASAEARLAGSRWAAATNAGHCGSVVGPPGYERIVHELAASPGTRIGAPTRPESGIVLTARFGSREKTALAQFLQENSIQTVAFDDAHASVALDAYSRFGKGGHPAALNFGDCCAYAVASVAGEPLLCLGDDFAETDLLLVSPDTDETGTDTTRAGEPAPE